MALEKATLVSKGNPFYQEPPKDDRPARGASSSPGKRAAIYVVREQENPVVPGEGDGELLAGLRSGNPAAADELLRRYQAKIINLAMSILKNESDAEEAAQDVFMTVICKSDTFQSPMDDWSKEVERDALNEELGRMIRKYTGELSEKYRIVFVLSDVEGLSNEETAKILGLTVPAIKSRLHRARLYLRERLSRYLREGKTGMAVR